MLGDLLLHLEEVVRRLGVHDLIDGVGLEHERGADQGGALHARDHLTARVRLAGGDGEAVRLGEVVEGRSGAGFLEVGRERVPRCFVGAARAQLLQDVVVDLGERLLTAGDLFLEADDVHAARAFDDVAHVADVQLEGGLFERRLERAARDDAEIAAVLDRERVLGVLLGELGERVLVGAARRREDPGGLRLDRVLGGGVGAGRHHEENVLQVQALGLLVVRLVGVVVVLDRLLVDRHLLGELLGRVGDVVDGDGVGASGIARGSSRSSRRPRCR